MTVQMILWHVAMQAPADAMLASAVDAGARLCPGCGYDLRGAPSERCPECGLAIDAGAQHVSNIPWAHRDAIGKRRAYRWTAWMAMLRPSRLAAEVARPVRFEDARAFALRTAWRAWWPLALLLTWWYAAALKLPVVPELSRDRGLFWHGGFGPFFKQVRLFTQSPPGNPLSLGFAMELACFVTLLAALYFAMIAMLRVPGYFFHPRDLPVIHQNRAVALSLYGGAALGWLTWLVPLLALAMWDQLLSYRWMTGRGGPWRELPGREPILVLAAVAPTVLVGWTWVTWMILLRRTLHVGATRIATMAICIPLMWLLILAAALSLPVMAFVLSIVWLSW